MAKAIHTMIRVLDLDQSIRFYDDAFGLKIAGRFDFDGFTLCYLRNDENDVEIELTHNHGQQKPYTHGDGYGHVAFVVVDLEGEHKRFTDLGFEPTPVKATNHEGAMLARFFFVQDPDGYKIEVLEKHGRYH